jgi:hypothetical protein
MELPDNIFSQDNKQPSQAMQPIPSQSIHQEQASVSKHSQLSLANGPMKSQASQAESAKVQNNMKVARVGKSLQDSTPVPEG